MAAPMGMATTAMTIVTAVAMPSVMAMTMAVAGEVHVDKVMVHVTPESGLALRTRPASGTFRGVLRLKAEAQILALADHLHGDSFPTASRAAKQPSGPPLTDASVLLLNGRQQLRHDGAAVWPHVDRIDCVAVVEKGHRVLDGDDERARATERARRRRPVAVEIVRVQLVDVGIAALSRLRRAWIEPASWDENVREMAVSDHEGVRGGWVLIKAVRK
eukprot:1046281-Pleurochrysis_carterae.AAC.2